jgi:hypothetical protein
MLLMGKKTYKELSSSEEGIAIGFLVPILKQLDFLDSLQKKSS